MSDDDYQLAPPYQPVRAPEYAENGCGRTTGQNLRVLALPTVIFLALLIGLLAGAWAIAAFLAFCFVLSGGMATIVLALTWPLGIRVDARGIRIGGVEAQEKGRSRVRNRQKPISGLTRAMHVYSTEWTGVRRVRVITDPQELQAVRANARSPRNGFPGAWWSDLGHAAWAPGRFLSARTEAVLVLEVRADLADYQVTRPPSAASNFQIYYKPGNDVSPDAVFNDFYMKWVVPTKDPERLRAALAMAYPPIPID